MKLGLVSRIISTAACAVATAASAAAVTAIATAMPRLCSDSPFADKGVFNKFARLLVEEGLGEALFLTSLCCMVVS